MKASKMSDPALKSTSKAALDQSSVMCSVYWRAQRFKQLQRDSIKASYHCTWEIDVTDFTRHTVRRHHVTTHCSLSSKRTSALSHGLSSSQNLLHTFGFYQCLISGVRFYQYFLFSVSSFPALRKGHTWFPQHLSYCYCYIKLWTLE